MLKLIWAWVTLLTLIKIGKSFELIKYEAPEVLSKSLENYLTRNDIDISEKCHQEFSEYFKALRTGQWWALKMFDASSRFPSGILSGNIADFGDFRECLNVQNGTIFGKYCLGLKFLPLSLSKELQTEVRYNPSFEKLTSKEESRAFLGWSVCAPSACSAEEIQKFYASRGTNYFLTESLCQDKPHRPDLDATAIAAITLIGTALGIMAISTAYDIFLHFKQKKPTSPLLTAFSVLTNGRKLLQHSKDPNQLLCLHGIRTFSLLWVILLHKFQVYHTIQPALNLIDYVKWLRKPSTRYVTAGTISIDTFLLLSGLLISYMHMNYLKKGVKFNVIVYYLHRYIRLTPILGVMMLLHVALYNSLGSHLMASPLMPIINEVVNKPCVEYWWSILLYVQNYVNDVGAFCVPPSWYLSIDMHLFLLSPLILIPLSKKPKYGFYILGFLTFCSILSPVLIVWFYKLRLGALFSMFSFEEHGNYNKYYYFNTHTRAAPWLFGIFLGYILFKIKQREIVVPVKKNYFRVLSVGIWGLALAVMYVCIFRSHDAMFGEYNRFESTFYIAMVPVIWSLAVSWVIFACVTGLGEPVNWFLSLPIFQFLSKISFTMYLSNYFLLLLLTLQNTKHNVMFSDYRTIYRLGADVIFTVLAGVVLTLAFEYPVAVIDGIIFSKKRKKNN